MLWCAARRPPSSVGGGARHALRLHAALEALAKRGASNHVLAGGGCGCGWAGRMGWMERAWVVLGRGLVGWGWVGWGWGSVPVPWCLRAASQTYQLVELAHAVCLFAAAAAAAAGRMGSLVSHRPRRECAAMGARAGGQAGASATKQSGRGRARDGFAGGGRGMNRQCHDHALYASATCAGWLRVC